MQTSIGVLGGKGVKLREVGESIAKRPKERHTKSSPGGTTAAINSSRPKYSSPDSGSLIALEANLALVCAERSIPLLEGVAARASPPVAGASVDYIIEENE